MKLKVLFQAVSRLPPNPEIFADLRGDDFIMLKILAQNELRLKHTPKKFWPSPYSPNKAVGRG